jgi:hypothetical protein
MAVTKKWKSLSVKIDNVAAMLHAVDTLTSQKLYVGVPNTTATRPPDPDDEPGEPINNAQLAYIHNFGSPARNIPARPFMTLGVKDAQPQIEKTLFKLGQLALRGDAESVIKGFNALGLIVASMIQKRLIAGPWVPLSEKTVEAKARRRKKRPITPAILDKYRKPLIDTSRLVKSITYVLRGK